MISYVAGSLFESPAQTLVNTVNTVGAMGKGIALTFKQIYPEMFNEYRDLCEKGTLKIGSLHLYRTPHKLVLNFPTKEHWRRPSKPEYIETGLKAFVSNFEKMRIRSIAFPPLGCGNGELAFQSVVRPIMDRYLKDLPIPVFIHAPLATPSPPEHRRPAEIKAWLQSSPRDLPFMEVWEDLVSNFRAVRSLQTITRGTGFAAEYVAGPPGPGIRIRTGGRLEFVRQDELEDTWFQLRDLGFLTAPGLPGRRERVASYIFPILAALPYVERVRISDEYESFRTNPKLGVRLAPTRVGRRPDQPALELS